MEKQQKQKVGWSSDATRALIGIWGESNVQEKLDGVKRNKDIYQDISKLWGTAGLGNNVGQESYPNL